MHPCLTPDPSAAWRPGRPAYLCDKPPSHFLSIRALPLVERMLQAICLRDGLTFWGEAAAAILEAEIRNAPPSVPVMPARLFGRTACRSSVHNLPPAQRFCSFPSARLLSNLRRIGAKWDRSPDTVAAMLLHRAALRFWVLQ